MARAVVAQWHLCDTAISQNGPQVICTTTSKEITATSVVWLNRVHRSIRIIGRLPFNARHAVVVSRSVRSTCSYTGPRSGQLASPQRALTLAGGPYAERIARCALSCSGAPRGSLSRNPQDHVTRQPTGAPAEQKSLVAPKALQPGPGISSTGQRRCLSSSAGVPRLQWGLRKITRHPTIKGVQSCAVRPDLDPARFRQGGCYWPVVALARARTCHSDAWSCQCCIDCYINAGLRGAYLLIAESLVATGQAMELA